MIRSTRWTSRSDGRSARRSLRPTCCSSSSTRSPACIRAMHTSRTCCGRRGSRGCSSRTKWTIRAAPTSTSSTRSAWAIPFPSPRTTAWARVISSTSSCSICRPSRSRKQRCSAWPSSDDLTSGSHPSSIAYSARSDSWFRISPGRRGTRSTRRCGTTGGISSSSTRPGCGARVASRRESNSIRRFALVAPSSGRRSVCSWSNRPRATSRTRISRSPRWRGRRDAA